MNGPRRSRRRAITDYRNVPDRLGVLRDPAFRSFFVGQSVSFFGTQVTALALPLTAVIVLDATAAEMGLLTAIGFVPFLLVGLLAGVWVDRMRRRPILIATDLISAAAVAIVPAAAILGSLRIELLYAVAFILGFVGVIAPVAYQSFVPTLAGRDRLVEANARLEASNSVAAIVGPGLGGLLVQLLTAPVALIIDAISYLVSAGFLASIRVAEPPPIPDEERASIRGQIGEGLRLVGAMSVLRALVSCGSIHNFFSRMIDALFVLYMVDGLGLGPAGVGIVFAAGGPGALLGAFLVGRLGRTLGVGPTIAVTQLLTGVARLLIPLAGGPVWLAVTVLVASEFLLGLVRIVFNVTQVSLRVAITPDRMHGRVNATMRFVMWSVTPFGALAGGLLAATALGLRGTIALAGVGVLAATLPLLVPGLRTIRRMPSGAST
jgi:predicted MFS family arabinose efflux permease